MKLRSTPITSDDLTEYLSECSADFLFELHTVKLLRASGLDCEHGGLYEDPTTKITRQFDIRATARADNCCVRLAIECKNVGGNFPVIVVRVPRHLDESFHEIAIVGEIEDGPNAHGVLESRAHVIRACEDESLYSQHAPVGKHLAQVGRDINNKIVDFDSDAFKKWAQALASADDLVTASYWEGSEDAPSISYVAVIPIVVVPDGRLWAVDYDANGERLTLPTLSKHCSLFVNRSYQMSFNGPTLYVSHVEFVTLSGLRDFVTERLKSRKAMEAIFPQAAINAAKEEVREGH